MINEEWSRVAANSICHAAQMSQAGVEQAISESIRPSVLFRPALSIDGDQWCALYGANLQDGVAGFGRSPDEAMRAFDVEWTNQIPQVRR